MEVGESRERERPATLARSLLKIAGKEDCNGNRKKETQVVSRRQHSSTRRRVTEPLTVQRVSRSMSNAECSNGEFAGGDDTHHR